MTTHRVEFRDELGKLVSSVKVDAVDEDEAEDLACDISTAGDRDDVSIRVVPLPSIPDEDRVAASLERHFAANGYGLGVSVRMVA